MSDIPVDSISFTWIVDNAIIFIVMHCSHFESDSNYQRPMKAAKSYEYRLGVVLLELFTGKEAIFKYGRHHIKCGGLCGAVP